MTNKSSVRARKPSAKKAEINQQNIPEQGKAKSSQTFATKIETVIPKLKEICPCEVTDKEKSLPFIQCDKCNQWWHTKCACISKAEAEKLDKLNIKYCCVLCVVKTISKQQAKIKEKLVEVLLEDNSKVKECRGEVKSPIDLTPVIEGEVSEGKQIIVKGNNNTERVIITEEDTGKVSIGREGQKDKELTGKESENTILAGEVELVSDQKKKEEIDKIIIIDNIPDSKAYTDSRNILKEIGNQVQGEIRFAYSLQRGGVAIHVKKSEDKKTIINGLRNTAFAQGNIYELSEKTQSVFLKSVPIELTKTEIKESLEGQDLSVKKVTRLTWRKTGRPLSVVKLILGSEQAKKLVKLKAISIDNISYKVEEKRKTQLRCYNCQGFGHIAHICKKSFCCVNCGEHHRKETRCNKPPKCKNCSGNHRASYNHCPVIQSNQNETDTAKYQKPQYINKHDGHASCKKEPRHPPTSGSLAAEESSLDKGISASNYEAQA